MSDQAVTTSLTREELLQLAREAGAACGEAIATMQLEADERLQQQIPMSPLEQSAQAILDGMEDWAREAMNTARATGSEQGRMLARALSYLRLRKEAEDQGAGAADGQPLCR